MARKTPKPAPIKLTELLDLEGVTQQRQSRAQFAVMCNRGQQLLAQSLAAPNPTFTVGTHPNAIIFQGQVARDILGGALARLVQEQKNTEAELEKLGVKIDDRSTIEKIARPANPVPAPAPGQSARKAKRKAAKVARKKARR